ncbi:B3 DNA binding domain-containing protein [Tanacetum coccineum]
MFHVGSCKVIVLKALGRAVGGYEAGAGLRMPFKRDQLANKEQVAIDDQDDDTVPHQETHQQQQQHHIPLPQPLQVVHPPAPVGDSRKSQLLPIKRVLTLSHVDTNYPFLPLTRKQVKDHIFVHWTPQQRELLGNDEEVILYARDVDTDEIYVMKLRWRGNYYNFIGKWGKIVRRKGHRAGKEIKIPWANGSLNFSVPYEPVVQTSIVVMMSHHHDKWPIRKVLTLSNVDINHPFLALPLKSVEDHILLYWASQHQIIVNARDDDTGDVFLMKLKWQGSYYNLIGKWGQIIRGKTLEVGQEIRVRWDNGYLVFSVA